MNELDIVHYIQHRQELEDLSNEDLARTLLREAPVFGLLGELAEIAAERLSPGIVERMAEAEAEPQDEPHHVGHPWSHAPRQASNTVLDRSQTDDGVRTAGARTGDRRQDEQGGT